MVLELKGASCIGYRDGMEGEADDGGLRIPPRVLTPQPSIPRYTASVDRFGFFRDGMRGVTGSGSTYDGSIFPISTSLELNGPACLRASFSSFQFPLPGIARNRNAVSMVRGERGGCVGSRRYKRRCGSTWALDVDFPGYCGSLEDEGGGRSLSKGSISSVQGKMLCHAFEISAVAP